MFAELRELLRSEAIRRHQLGSKGILVFLPVHFLQLLDQAVDRRTLCHIRLHAVCICMKCEAIRVS